VSEGYAICPIEQKLVIIIIGLNQAINMHSELYIALLPRYVFSQYKLTRAETDK
jgi:hypothetical protein